ncbi:ADP-ribose pyrophosphatase [Belliella baltica DSM 15883]|uniref:8-oxo-dGTP diphosphatase n=1 Tax=Belliella baltica (strain DSM 15883 / CIP 108006 / LMG 21964 / BA134) TaxID=866536 RepID=I3Z6A3_BELBD|nr:(deoxy)nucleoside triphosphate pyrophosphohydrolase [Belliella baltica]AFL84771.1 ADP-ribose pyrophosphatase [Belliella baltica DSM 15883]
MQSAIRVTCAIIFENKQVLCAQRSKNMSHPLLWEFPGGKIEERETESACIIREIKEELNIEINILERLESHYHTYPQKKEIELIPFICGYKSGNFKLKEHKEIRWVPICEIDQLDWAAADIPIMKFILNKYCSLQKISK